MCFSELNRKLTRSNTILYREPVLSGIRSFSISLNYVQEHKASVLFRDLGTLDSTLLENRVGPPTFVCLG